MNAQDNEYDDYLRMNLLDAEIIKRTKLILRKTLQGGVPGVREEERGTAFLL